jgi:hypothetical protein
MEEKIMNLKRVFKKDKMKIIGVSFLVIVGLLAVTGNIPGMMYLNEGGGGGEYTGDDTTPTSPDSTATPPPTTTSNTEPLPDVYEYDWTGLLIIGVMAAAGLVIVVVIFKRESF